MGSTTTTQTAAPTVKELLKKHVDTIKAFHAETEKATKATKDGDKKAAASANARKANRSREIGEIELDLALSGAKPGTDYETFVKPSTSKSRQVELSQDQIETDLVKVVAIMKGDFPEQTKASADNRITALLAKAEKRGYKVSDPRQNSKTK